MQTCCALQQGCACRLYCVLMLCLTSYSMYLACCVILCMLFACVRVAKIAR